MRLSFNIKNKKRFYTIVFSVFLTTFLAITSLLVYNSFVKGNDLDVNAKLGQLEGKTEEEIQAELNRVVDEGMFNISINSNPVYKSGTSRGSVKIENVPSNRYLMQVDITLDDTGETVYKTGLIEPNHYIQTAKLDKFLEKGEYSATATFNAYEKESKEYVGTAAAKILLTIQS